MFLRLALLPLALLPAVIGLSIVSKTGFEDSPALLNTDQSESESKSVEFVLYGSKQRNKTRTREYIPVILKRSDHKIEARIPLVVEKSSVRVRKGKPTSTERQVPIVRGAAVPLRADATEIESIRIEGLSPPSQTATDPWFQNLETNTRYPDSNGYYPNVGDGYTTPRPTYGVPNQGTPRPTYGVPNQWGCQAPVGNGNNPSQGNWPNQGYPPNQGNYPPSQGNYPPGQGNYPPSQGNYPPSQGGYPPSQGGGYPPSQGGGYPPSQGGGYPPSQGNFPHYTPSQGQYPSNPSSNYPSSQGNYPSNNGWTGSQWQQTNSQRPYNVRQAGRWTPCEPFDLADADGRRRSSSGCPQSSRSSNHVRFESSATPTSVIDDKTLFKKLPKDVEEITIRP